MTRWPPFSRQRNKASGQSLRLQWRTLAADIMAVRLQNSNRRNDVRHYRLVHSDLLDFAGLSSNLAYITSVFIGYIGTDSIVWLIKRFSLLKKPEKEDGRNQRSTCVPRYAGVVGGESITDVRRARNHGYDVIVGGELFTDYSDHPRKLVTLNPNSNQQAPDATSFFPVGGMPTAKRLGLKDFSPKKSGRCGIAAD